MSDLVQFILANPLILIIIVGVLVSSLSKLGQSTQQQEERQTPQRQSAEPQRRQQPAEQRQEEVRWEDYFPSESAPPEQAYEPINEPSRQSEAQQRDTAKRQNELYERHREARRKVKELKNQSAPVVAVMAESEQANSEGKLDMDFKNVSGKKMMEAVVWSEVLGPPKSRQRGSKGRSF
ncbi:MULTISPECIES: hypothetical protein [Bacillaceae]|uniref:Uncharacterized protein n=1 Tax=Alkalicoccobacillus plakortidis TaxID=444060 RepID=A0A9D5DQ83_9BACI|nr:MULTISPECIES: hypothetical protein [Bacillaceae]KQL58010.1 hypothetical protein AN965_06770 [Alkalicoccobacillus plakortidis]